MFIVGLAGLPESKLDYSFIARAVASYLVEAINLAIGSTFEGVDSRNRDVGQQGKGPLVLSLGLNQASARAQIGKAFWSENGTVTWGVILRLQYLLEVSVHGY